MIGKLQATGPGWFVPNGACLLIQATFRRSGKEMRPIDGRPPARCLRRCSGRNGHARILSVLEPSGQAMGISIGYSLRGVISSSVRAWCIIGTAGRRTRTRRSARSGNDRAHLGLITRRRRCQRAHVMTVGEEGVGPLLPFSCAGAGASTRRTHGWVGAGAARSDD